MSDAREMTQLIRRLSWFAGAAVATMALTLAGFQIAEDHALEHQADTRERARLARSALSAATDRETGVRGFLLTRDDRSLLPNTIGKAQLPRLLDSLATLAHHDAGEAERLRSASDALATWDTGFAEPAVKGVLSREDTGLAGKHLFDVVRARFGNVIADADADYTASEARTNEIGLGGAIALLVELAAFVATLLYLIRGRLVAQTTDLTRQQTLLEQQAIELEVQMEEMNLTNESLARSLEDIQKKDNELAASLRQREEAAAFLDSALASAPVGFVFWNKDLRIIKANRRLSSARGLEPSDYVGKTVADLAPTLAAQMQAVLQSILANGHAVDGVQLHESNTTGKTVRRQRGTFYPVTKADGSLIAIGGIVIDVGDEYEREQRIRRSEERYRYVSKATRDAVYEWDTSTNVFQWNEGIHDLFGYAPADVDDSPNWITTLVHPDDVEQVTDTFSDALTNGAERWQLSYRLRRKDGKYAPVEGRAHI
ncbi:MAG TPA: PAS domain-containing protein, partial [Gemmatimonadaceae bacterium]|nr:PAS domain-containing protein [Gemmatimonadaceae bacterium]